MIENWRVMFQCPHSECRHLFIGVYVDVRQPSSVTRTVLRRVTPFTPKKVEFPAEVSDTSPAFVEIFNQAARAESLDLDQIAGMGYRKALEFLIKDYLISERPEDKEGIESSLLGTTINNYVTDSNIKACATRAAWLGNDETHYLRKWTSHDIDDLKRLVQLTVNWIQSALLTKRYEKEMQR